MALSKSALSELLDALRAGGTSTSSARHSPWCCKR